MTDSNLTNPSHAGASSHRVRVTLRYIEILDSKDFDTYGEFRFRFRAGVPERDELVECRIPDEDQAHLSISEHPAKNRVSLEKVLFEGDVGAGEQLVVEAEGEEVDRLTPNDPLTPYRRVFPGPIEESEKPSPPGVLREFLEFLRNNKKWWITPIVIVSLLLAGAALSLPSPVAPFIYSLF